MHVPDTSTVRRSFVNSSRSKAASMTFPTPWPEAESPELDFVGWVDPKAPKRAYLVAGPETLDDLVAVELRLPSATVTGRKGMCDLCQSTDTPDGSLLMVAARAGARGRSGDTVGVYMCADFGCSARVREPLLPHQKSLTGMPDTRVPDLIGRVRAFVDRVRG